MVERVALVSPYDFAQNGGVTEHIQQLTRQLRQRDIDVTILAPASRSDLAESQLVSLGTVMPIPINGSVARTTLSPAVVNTVSALLAHRQFDVIHLHEPLAPMLPLSVLNASPSPNVGTFHASGERSFGYAASRRLLDWLAQRLTVRVAVSQAAAHFAQRYFAGEYTIIPNGVDTARFNIQVEPLPAWRDGRPTLLFVGRFEEPRKGFEHLLRSFRYIQQAIPAVRLLVVGRGDPTSFQQQASDQGMHSIHFIGSVSAEDLPRYYRSADLVCVPSTGQESFGIVLAEAMSSGSPIVASDIEGYRQVVTHRREGLLVPPAQPEALAAATIHLLRTDRLRSACAVAGPQTAARYAWQDISERVIDVYERAQYEEQHKTQTQHIIGLPRFIQPTSTITPQGAILFAAPVVQSTPISSAHAQGVTHMLTEPFEARVRATTQRLVGRLLGRTKITPNMLTIVGLILTLIVTAALATGHFVVGGILVLLTSAFDMFDGALARATERNSVFGAFFDSTIDRYAEALIFFGLLLHYQGMPNSQYEIGFVYLSIIGSLMVSYTRARAEALGLECKVGFLARPERVILLSIGLIIGWMSITLAILALFTNFTAIQRIYHVWSQTERQQPQPAKIKPQRRSWFASRDQSPS